MTRNSIGTTQTAKAQPKAQTPTPTDTPAPTPDKAFLAALVSAIAKFLWKIVKADTVLLAKVSQPKDIGQRINRRNLRVNLAFAKSYAQYGYLPHADRLAGQSVHCHAVRRLDESGAEYVEMLRGNGRIGTLQAVVRGDTITGLDAETRNLILKRIAAEPLPVYLLDLPPIPADLNKVPTDTLSALRALTLDQDRAQEDRNRADLFPDYCFLRDSGLSAERAARELGYTTRIMALEHLRSIPAAYQQKYIDLCAANDGRNPFPDPVLKSLADSCKDYLPTEDEPFSADFLTAWDKATANKPEKVSRPTPKDIATLRIDLLQRGTAARPLARLLAWVLSVDPATGKDVSESVNATTLAELKKDFPAAVAGADKPAKK